MLDGYKKYLLINYAWDCGSDDGPDFDKLEDARRYAKRCLADGWETVYCVNTQRKAVSFVLGDQMNSIDKIFRPEVCAVLRANSRMQLI